MWPESADIHPEVCYCYCHRGDGGKVAHIYICCKICEHCGFHIKFEVIAEHEKECKKAGPGKLVA